MTAQVLPLRHDAPRAPLSSWSLLKVAGFAVTTATRVTRLEQRIAELEERLAQAAPLDDSPGLHEKS